MILGRNTIVLDIEEAKALDKAISIAHERSSAEGEYKFLQRHGVMNAVSNLRSVIREIEDID